MYGQARVRSRYYYGKTAKACVSAHVRVHVHTRQTKSIIINTLYPLNNISTGTIILSFRAAAVMRSTLLLILINSKRFVR